MKPFILYSLLFSAAITTISASSKDDSCFPPKNFIYGCSTSAPQIEGAWNEDGRGPSIWDTFARLPGKIADNTTLDVTDDFYHRYKSDIKLYKQLGINAQAMTISWSRILPKGRGKVNQKGVEFYKNVVNELLKKGITPVVTLYHWDCPQALMDEYKCWLSPKIVEDFANYARVVFNALSDKVKIFITMNEPAVFCQEGYRWGDNAPGRCSDRTICPEGDSFTEPWICGHNALLAHASAVDVYRREFQKSGGKISIILDGTFTYPYNPASHVDQIEAERAMLFWFGWFGHPIYFGDYPHEMRDAMGDTLPTFTPDQKQLIKGSADFFAWDAYTSQWATAMDPSTKANCTKGNDQGWPECQIQTQVRLEKPQNFIGRPTASAWHKVVPEGLRLGLQWISKTYNPSTIYITENGLGLEYENQIPLEQAIDDVDRVWFYKLYLEQLRLAIEVDRLPVKGYFAWSCLDNFEWADGGLSIRFGLIHVNFNTQVRTFKRSAYFLRDYFAGKVSKHDVRYI